MANKDNRRKKTAAEIKQTKVKLENKEINKHRAEIKKLTTEREEIQGSISDAIGGVIAVKNTVIKPEIQELLGTEKTQTCVNKLQEFKSTISSMSTNFNETIAQMEKLEEDMLKNPSSKDTLMLNYTMLGLPLIETAQAISYASVETVGVIGTLLNEINETPTDTVSKQTENSQ